MRRSSHRSAAHPVRRLHARSGDTII
ncbi:MAG: hypothetical protein AAGC55_10175 [Myxococcota bacterium]